MLFCGVHFHDQPLIWLLKLLNQTWTLVLQALPARMASPTTVDLITVNRKKVTIDQLHAQHHVHRINQSLPVTINARLNNGLLLLKNNGDHRQTRTANHNNSNNKTTITLDHRKNRIRTRRKLLIRNHQLLDTTSRRKVLRTLRLELVLSPNLNTNNLLINSNNNKMIGKTAETAGNTNNRTIGRNLVDPSKVLLMKFELQLTKLLPNTIEEAKPPKCDWKLKTKSLENEIDLHFHFFLCSFANFKF